MNAAQGSATCLIRRVLPSILLCLLLCPSPFSFAKDVLELRQQQEIELRSLEQKYAKKARKVAGRPDGTVDADNKSYQHVEQEYFDKKQALQEKYKKQDTRPQEMERIENAYKDEIDVSGSTPKDVRADVDLTAKSDDVAERLAQEWRDAGDKVTYDPDTGKYRNETQDATLWEPTTPERQTARQADHDAYISAGGKDAAGVKGADAVPDPLGYNYDNQQKFDHAGESNDLKTQGKSLSKTAKSTGHSSETTKQADALRNYKDTHEAGITKLGESPEVKNKKVEQWQKSAQSEMDVIRQKAQKTSEVKQKVRRKLADQVDKTAKGNADQDWKDQLSNEPGQSKKKSEGPSAGEDTSKAIRDRTDQVDQTNRDAESRINRDPPDAPAAPPSAPDDPGSPPPPSSDAPDSPKSPPDAPPKPGSPDAPDSKTKNIGPDSPDKAPTTQEPGPAKPKPTELEPRKVEADIPPAGKSDADSDTLKNSSSDSTEKAPTAQDADPSRGEVEPGKKLTGDADPAPRTPSDTDSKPKPVSDPDADLPTRKQTDAEPAVRASSDADSISKPLSDPDVDISTRKQTDTEPKAKTATDSEAPNKSNIPNTRVGSGKLQKGVDTFGVVDDVIGAMDSGSTYVEGLREGDAGKALSPIVGQDTTERVKGKSGDKWVEDEGKVVDAKTTEVASEIEAKLRRKGATADEARKARDQYEKGDRKGFQETVKKVKAKGVIDTGQRTLDPGDALQEEDGIGERLTEGAKQTGRYVDGFYGGMIERTEKSVEERDKLNKDRDQTQVGIQNDVDNQVLKKLMRMGVSHKEAKQAVEDKRNGDISSWKKVLKDLHEKGATDTQKEGQGLDATGRTSSYEWEDLGKDMKDNAERETLRRGTTILKPIDMVYEWQENEHLGEMKDNERAAGYYKTMRKYGATKSEAMKAARDYAEKDDTSGVRAIYKKYKEQNAKKRLKESEGSSPETDEAHQEGENEEKAGLGAYAKNRSDQRQEEVEGSQDSMKGQTKVADATNEGNREALKAKIEVNRAGEEGQKIQRVATGEAAAEQAKDRWGNVIGESVTEGVESGVRMTGAALGRSVAREVSKDLFGDSREEKRRKEQQAKAATDSSAGGGRSAGQATASTRPGAKPGAGNPSTASKKPPMVEKPGASPIAKPAAKSASKPSSGGGTIYCPKCGGTEFGPREIVIASGNGGDNEALHRSCLNCGSFGVMGTPPSTPSSVDASSSKPAATPAPKPEGKQCPSCGENTLSFVKRGNGWADGGAVNEPWTLYKCSYCHRNIEYSDDEEGWSSR